MSLFGAGWTLGAIKSLAEKGVHSATFYEMTGARGLMFREQYISQFAEFPALPGSLYPIYHIFADVGEFSEGQVIHSKTNNPLKVTCLVLKKKQQIRVLVANLERTQTNIRVTGLSDQVWVKKLDEMNTMEAMQSPEEFRQQPGQKLKTEDGKLNLNFYPYSIARIDSIGV